MADIVLATLNARYIHAWLGGRCLLANLADLKGRAVLKEFTLKNRPVDVAEAILAESPLLVGLGVYVWNLQLTTELAAILKRIRPEIVLVLGGPEVSFFADAPPVVESADYVIAGEGELAFAELCRAILSGRAPKTKLLPQRLPDLDQLCLPYDLYDERDVQARATYVETSRGCPFSCEFCLSALDVRVRTFPLEVVLTEVERLRQRGVRQFRFVDRTFNSSESRARAVLDYFAAHKDQGLFAHFEVVPDRFPAALIDQLAVFPTGAVQLELGVQSLNPAVTARIGRRQDPAKVIETIRDLRARTAAHLHADLILGLPGEDLASFASGFDTLFAAAPHEIQVGVLKGLRGAPISKHDAPFGMIYNPAPPYEILASKDLDLATLQRLKRFARAWDLVWNRGHWRKTAPLLWGAGSPFFGTMSFADALYADQESLYAVSRDRLIDLFRRHLVGNRGIDVRVVEAQLAVDCAEPSPRPAAAPKRQWIHASTVAR